MKICTACNTAYSDDSLNYCLIDGTVLTPEKSLSPNQPPPYNPADWSQAEVPTQVSIKPNLSPNPEIPPTIAASFSPPPSFIPQNFSAQPAGSGSNRSLKYLVVVIGILIFGVGAGLAVVLNWDKLTGGGKPPANTTSGGNVTVANTAANSGKTSLVNSVSPEANKKTAAKFELPGTWKGKFNGAAATLDITTQNDETFSGTLSQKGFLIEFAGQINHEKRAVSMKETKVLKTPANSNWNLGNNNGTISENGKTMSGKGKDKNVSYSWSFAKQ